MPTIISLKIFTSCKILHDFFNKQLRNFITQFIDFRDLQLLHERQQKKCEKLEKECREEEARHVQKVNALQDRNRVSNFYASSIKVSYP